MKVQRSDLKRELLAKRETTTRPSRAPLEPEGADKALLDAGAMGNQAFQQRAGDDPEAMLAKLGDGEPLAAEARRRMEAAFGEDFSGVRMHKDATAGLLASEQGARAFAVGEHVAFGSGEFQPGTLVGDAVLAHELAHVMQQREGDASGAKEDASGSVSALEDDADVAAGNAAQSLWSGGSVSPVDKPRRSSGLRLARCNGDTKPDTTTKKSVAVGITKLHGSSLDPNQGVEYANKKVFNQASVEVKPTRHADLDEAKTKKVLGDDLILDEFTDVKKPTAEEKELLKVNPTPGGVAMYYVKGLPVNRGESFPPYAGVGVLASVVGNATNETSFAHELGHVLMNDDGTMHSEPDVENIMHAPEGAKKRFKLTPDQIKKVRESSVVK